MRTSTRILLMLSVVWMLTACASSTVIKEPKRQIPQSLLTECQTQSIAPDGKLSTILRTSIERSEQYQECKGRHKALSDWVRNEK